MRPSKYFVLGSVFVLLMSMGSIFAQPPVNVLDAPTTLDTREPDSIQYVDPGPNVTCASENPLVDSCNVGEKKAADLKILLNAGDAVSCSGDNLWAYDRDGNPLFAQDAAFLKKLPKPTTLNVMSDRDGFLIIVRVKSGGFCALFNHAMSDSTTRWSEDETKSVTALRLYQYLQTGDDPARFGDAYVDKTLPNCTTLEDVKRVGLTGRDCALTKVLSLTIPNAASEAPVASFWGVYGEKGVPQAWNGFAATSKWYLDFKNVIPPTPTITPTALATVAPSPTPTATFAPTALPPVEATSAVIPPTGIPGSGHG